MDINKVTVFIGNQGAGKSTIAKLISTFTWIEKTLVRGDYSPKWVKGKSRLQKHFLAYHRLENYFRKETKPLSVLENTKAIVTLFGCGDSL